MLTLRLLALLAGSLCVSLAMPPQPEVDLMDLYVQHMDETMGTRAYYERIKAQKGSENRGERYKRSVIESPLFQVANPIKQSLEGDDRPKGKKKIPYEKDALDFPNGREENHSKDTDILHEDHDMVNAEDSIETLPGNEIRVTSGNVFIPVSEESVKGVLLAHKKGILLKKSIRDNLKNDVDIQTKDANGNAVTIKVRNDNIWRSISMNTFGKLLQKIKPKKDSLRRSLENSTISEPTSFGKQTLKDDAIVRDEDSTGTASNIRKVRGIWHGNIELPLRIFLPATTTEKPLPKALDDISGSYFMPVRYTHRETSINDESDELPVNIHLLDDDKEPMPIEKVKEEEEDESNQDFNNKYHLKTKRSVNSVLKDLKFSRYEKLDEDGDVVLEWDPTDDENITFRVTAKTLGYIGLGFNDKGHMMGADIVLAWVDDHTHVPTLLDSHGVVTANAAPETDASQDVHLIHGVQNSTHTVITFTRRWQTCDPQDRSLTGDTIRVLWALHQTDPELNAARFHGDRRGSRALRLRAPAPHPPPTIDDPDMIKWDVKLNQFTVTNTSDTVYWCKIFKAPKLNRKHHMIGYTPLVEKANEALVHHVILYECASTQPILAEHARLAGAHCYSPTMPKEWDSCLQPVLAWARGSRGEWLPEHVGLPIAEHQEGSYYMLEVHYNNKLGKQVIDSSGVRLHLTPNTRKMEAGIMVAGVAVSPLHMVPPQQKEYATAGYCTPQCTNKMFEEDGINVVSVVLHSHLAGRRLSLKHIRQGKELPPIVQDNHFDFDYQQSHTLEREVKILPGDELVAECVYDTRDRTKPTFGGYAAYQEMCLAFVVHYPRSPLAACYSMTPVKEFFNALNVQSFKGVTMEQVEKLFLSTTTETVTLPVSPNHHSPMYPDFRSNDDVDVDIIRQAKSALISKGDYIDYDDIFARLVIEKPDEFKDHTLSDHIAALAWNDTALSKSIERSLYHGKHVTFCRTREDKLPRAPSIQMFPNYTALPESNNTYCKEIHAAYGSTGITSLPSLVLLLTLLTAPLLR